MLHLYLSALRAGLDDAEHHLQRRKAPLTRVEDGPVLDHRVVQLLELCAAVAGAHVAVDREVDVVRAAVVVEDEPAGPVADVAALACRDEQAEVLRNPELLVLRLEHLALLQAADAQRLLVLGLVAGALAHLAAHLDTLLGRVALAVVPPRHELRAHHVAVAVVADERGRAVLELQERGVVAGDGALRHPLAGGAAHALHHAAAEQPDAVYLVRQLAHRQPAALFHVQLFPRARAEHPVRVGERIDGAGAPYLAGLDDLPHRADGRGEAARVPGEELHAGAVGRLHHLLRVFEVERHRLLNHDVLPGLHRPDRVLGVEAVRRRDPHGLDLRVRQHLVVVAIALRVVALGEPVQRVFIGVAAGHEPELRHRLHRGQHLRAANADADHSES